MIILDCNTALAITQEHAEGCGLSIPDARGRRNGGASVLQS